MAKAANKNVKTCVAVETEIRAVAVVRVGPSARKKDTAVRRVLLVVAFRPARAAKLAGINVAVKVTRARRALRVAGSQPVMAVRLVGHDAEQKDMAARRVLLVAAQTHPMAPLLAGTIAPKKATAVPLAQVAAERIKLSCRI